MIHFHGILPDNEDYCVVNEVTTDRVHPISDADRSRSTEEENNVILFVFSCSFVTKILRVSQF